MFKFPFFPDKYKDLSSMLGLGDAIDLVSLLYRICNTSFKKTQVLEHVCVT